MRPSGHLAISTAVGGAAWAISGEPWALPVAVGSGVLVDADHAPDYWWTYAMRRRPIAILMLHGWEWLLGLVVIGIWIEFPWWLLAVVLGYGCHVATDHLFNGGGPWCYLLAYRIRHGFRKEKIAPHWELRHGYEILRKEVPFSVALIEWWHRRSSFSKTTGAADAKRQAEGSHETG